MAKLMKRGKNKTYYAWVRYAPGARGRKLTCLETSDRGCAEQKLKQLQAEADKRKAGFLTKEQERLKLPLAELIDVYREHLEVSTSSADHQKNVVRLLERLFTESLQWLYWRQIDASALMKYLQAQSVKPEKPWTEAYCNTFIRSVKAFTNWATPEGDRNPLAKLPRFSMKNARQTRAKRAANLEERSKLVQYWSKLPWDRQVSYSLAMLNGLRRNEIGSLTWDDVVLNNTVPFIRNLKQKMGSDIDQIPLHPRVVDLLRTRRDDAMPMPSVSIVAAVPDDKTVRKDVDRAKVAYTDARGRILSLHALRHTFSTMLGETAGVTGAIAKALMRHSRQSVTDGYTHVELSAMRDALDRLAIEAPEEQANVQLMTGTDGLPAASSTEKVCDQICDQVTSAQPGFDQLLAGSGGSALLIFPRSPQGAEVKKTSVNTECSSGSVLRLLSQMAGAANMAEPWPDTQVD